MSYLLDALKKAELERRQSTIDSQESDVVVSEKTAVMPVWVVVLISVLLMLTLIKLFVQSDGGDLLSEGGLISEGKEELPLSTNDAVSMGSSNVDQKTRLENNDNAPVINGDQASQNGIVGSHMEEKSGVYRLKPGEVLVSPVVETDSGINDQSKFVGLPLVKSLSGLNDHEKSQLPNIEFQSHMLSSVPEYSSVIVNGLALSEGEYLDSNVVVFEINSVGMILEVSGLYVEIPKGISWVNN